MSLHDAQRLEALEDVLERLRVAAAGNIVVVEGIRDLAALEALGIGGQHVTINQGKSLQSWMDELAEQAHGRTIILMTDWDRTGGRLDKRLREGLAARLHLDYDLRARLGKATWATALEDVPAELESLRRRLQGH